MFFVNLKIIHPFHVNKQLVGNVRVRTGTIPSRAIGNIGDPIAVTSLDYLLDFLGGAGRGTLEAFPDFALWAAQQRLVEVKEVGAEAIVSACPWCKDNFSRAVTQNGGKLKVFDISELILASIEA